MTLLELAAHCEAAAGPDRPLDECLMYAASNAILDNPPRYTASIDAAMTLVPEGWSMSFGEQRGWPVGKQMFAWLADHNTPDGIAERHVEGRAATPALALCAAALRARAATPSSNTQEIEP